MAYEPDAKLTRAEIAKLVAKAVTLVSKEDIKGTKSFADIKATGLLITSSTVQIRALSMARAAHIIPIIM